MVYKFNPTLIKPEELRETLVAREPLIGRLLKKIKESGINGSLTHHILVGPRGMGKTHILLLIHYGIKEENLKEWIPIKLSEEEYSVSTLGDLFLRVLEELMESHPSEELMNLLEKLKISSEEELVEYSLEFMKKFRKKNKKRFLLLLDNIHLTFQQIGDEAQIGRLREVLMKDDLFMIIGATPTLFNEIIDYNAPFYNFFEIENLSELSLEESKHLILKRAEYDKHENIVKDFDNYAPRIKAILHLTGGNPRLILMFYEIITEFGVLEVQTELKKLLDELTPYYQAKIEILPPQQRKIFDTMALMDGPATQTEITEKTRISRSTVISQMKRLFEMGYVRPAKQKRRKYVLYEISERLFRIWREMRTAKSERTKFLVKFLEVWYTPGELYDEFKKLKTEYGEHYKKGDVAQAKKIIEQLGYVQDAVKTEKWFEICEHRIEKLLEMKDLKAAEEEIEKLKSKARKEDNKKELAKAYLCDCRLWYHRKDPSKALDAINNVLAITPDSDIWFIKGNALSILKRYDEAEKAYREAIRITPEYVEVHMALGILFEKLEKYDEAEKEFRETIKINPKYGDAHHNLGNLLKILRRYDEAEKEYLDVIRINPEDEEAHNNLGILLAELKRYDGAEREFREAIEINSEYAQAHYNLGLLFHENLKRYEEAEKEYRKATRINPDYGWAHDNLGNLLQNLKRFDEAEKSHRKAIRINPNHANAHYNLGNLLRNLGKYNEALEFLNNAIKLNPKDMDSWFNRSIVLTKLTNYDESLKSANKTLSIAKETDKKQLPRVMLLFVNIHAHFDEYKKAEQYIRKAFEYETDEKKLNSLLFSFIADLISEGMLEFASSALKTIEEVKGREYAELFAPFSIAVKYLKTRDDEILDRIHPEVREIVEEIIKKTGKNKKG
ncbi:hypothetical protein BEH94_01150 [Candidatus Altiarchaeales archaeon WOR_SM1_SCG]|nr:hypothetical protein BEH94_01150 [Candidatus Altiarchaeales archaeon WOR_SM1_SCG]